MDIETGHIIWNVILTLIVGPFFVGHKIYNGRTKKTRHFNKQN